MEPETEPGLPLAIYQCCTRYVVSDLLPVPRCPACGQEPVFVKHTTWRLELSEREGKESP